jgi:hypothetical protein
MEASPMRVKRIVAAASLGAVTMAVAVISAAPPASADVGDLDISWYNSSGLLVGTDQDVVANLTTDECDSNQPPSGTASVVITNLTDMTVLVSTTCSTSGTPVAPGESLVNPWGISMGPATIWVPGGA